MEFIPENLLKFFRNNKLTGRHFAAGGFCSTCIVSIDLVEIEDESMVQTIQNLLDIEYPKEVNFGKRPHETDSSSSDNDSKKLYKA